jgi:hypothetical protein
LSNEWKKTGEPDRRHPTKHLQENIDRLDSCHIVDKSLVRDLFEKIGKRPVELEDDNLPCFSGTMEMNRYRDNTSPREGKDTAVLFLGTNVNEARKKVLTELQGAGADEVKKRVAWQSAENFVRAIYRDEPCLFEVAKKILDYAVQRASLLQKA